ncbi:hypothetical protein MTR_1g074000 [Medicago truncatula]|uniref:Uncharacterized protein n=1 Tax=Medicago truncatula TaxID=3880 RepID=A0A072VMN6_MEDTR|nr:hypothetical protein MTR_1g074000 [Medicago truncatula]
MEDGSCGLSAVIRDENGSVLAARTFQKLSQDTIQTYQLVRCEPSCAAILYL